MENDPNFCCVGGLQTAKNLADENWPPFSKEQKKHFGKINWNRPNSSCISQYTLDDAKKNGYTAKALYDKYDEQDRHFTEMFQLQVQEIQGKKIQGNRAPFYFSDAHI